MMTRMAALALGASLAAAGSAAGQQMATLLKQPLPLDPGMMVTMVTYDVPPAAAGPISTAGTPGHRHNAATYAYVAVGAVMSRLGDGPEKRFAAGEAWAETPLQPHYIVNASKTEPAKVVVVYISKAATTTLTEPLPK
jgi:quercetin dioxygenase-like cupin family protein